MSNSKIIDMPFKDIDKKVFVELLKHAVEEHPHLFQGMSIFSKREDLLERVIVVEEELKNLREQGEIRFNQVDRQIEQLDKRLETTQQNMEKRFEMMQQNMDKRFEMIQQNMDKRFEQVDKRFEIMQHYMDKRFQQVDKKFNLLIIFMTLGFSGISALMTIYRFFG